MSAYQDSEHADPTAADLSALWNRARKMSGYGDDRLAAVESLLEYNPNHARAKSLLAILLANRDSTKNRSRSLSLAREAISLRPEDAALKVAFARLCGDSESALEEKVRSEDCEMRISRAREAVRGCCPPRPANSQLSLACRRGRL